MTKNIDVKEQTIHSSNIPIDPLSSLEENLEAVLSYIGKCAADGPKHVSRISMLLLLLFLYPAFQ